MAKVDMYVDVPDRSFISAIFSAPLDIALKAMEQEGYELIPFVENMILRTDEFERHLHIVKASGRGIYEFMPRSLSMGNYVSEGIVYVPGEGRYITRNSPVLKRPEEFVAAERANRPFYIIPSELEDALKESVKVPYDFGYKTTDKKHKDDKNWIPLSKFGEDEVLRFCFSYCNTSSYKKMLRKTGMKGISVSLNEENYVNAQEQPFAEQLSFGGIGNGSPIWGSSREVRGVLRVGWNKVIEVKT